MASEWYCRIAGQEFGPFSASQLRALAADGRLSPGDPLRQGDSGVWVPAASVKGLFDRNEIRLPSQPATGRTEVPAETRSRRLLKATPIEDASDSVTQAPALTRLVDRDDAGIDLASLPPELPPPKPERPKGWRSTGLDFLAEEPPLPAQHALHPVPRPSGVAAIGKRSRTGRATKPRRGHGGDPVEPIRRWTLPVLLAVLVVLLAVWMMLGQGKQFFGGRGGGVPPSSTPETLPSKASPKAKTPASSVKTTPPGGQTKPNEITPRPDEPAKSGSRFRPPPPDPIGKKQAAGSEPVSPPQPKTSPQNTIPAAQRSVP